MGLNCKQGDLAVIVRSFAGNHGRIVRCVEYIGVLGWRYDGYVPTWRIDRELVTEGGTRSAEIPDWQLRPIRDNDGEDEILRLVGKPETVGA